MCHSERSEESFTAIKTKISPVGRNDKTAFLGLLQEAHIYKDLLRINEISETGHLGIGEAYYEMGKYALAIDEFKKVIEINPKNLDAYYNLAYIYAERKDFYSSLDWLEKAVSAGFIDLEAIRRDKVFAPIISDKRFEVMEKR